MLLSALAKNLLNKFAESQPALNDSFNPRGSSEVQLGDLMDDALGSFRSKTYRFKQTAQGVYILGDTIPAGAILTRAFTAAQETITSGGATELDLKIGTDGILTGLTTLADLNTAPRDVTTFTWTEATAVSVPLGLAGGVPTAEIKTADWTAGDLMIVIEYIHPLD